MANSRIEKKLTAAFLKYAPAGKYSDGGGLELRKRDRTSGRWYLRFSLAGRRREFGLGSFKTTSLAKAREAAEEARRLIRKHIDPIDQRQLKLAQLNERAPTLSEIVPQALEARKSELKGGGVAGRWMSPLNQHILPKWGHYPVDRINQIVLRDMVKEIWHAKASTAEKALQRVNIVLKYGAALGYDVDLQAYAKARALLGPQNHRSKHHPSMPWRDVPEFFAFLDKPSKSNLCLKLVILTGHRLSPCQNISACDIDGDVWTAPGETLKGKEGRTADFRIKLSDAALEVVDQAKRFNPEGKLFSNGKSLISNTAMRSALSVFLSRKPYHAVNHGFRNSLRDWAEETQPDASYETKESLLQHQTKGQVERAYNRYDYFEERARLYQRWADFVCGKTEY